MDLKFTPPDLRRFDLFVGEMIVAPVAQDERPPQGTAGLLDYRLLGAISRLIESESFVGQVGDSYVLKPRPRIPFDRLLLVGMGKTAEFNAQVFAAVVEQILRLLAEKEVRRAVVELPGRAQNLIEPEVAATILVERAANYPLLDTWTLIDNAEATRGLTSRLRQDRASAWGRV